MTSFPADVLGISDRGTVQANMIADLIIFDPAKVRETATYPNPFQLADGFDVVVVNGKIARQNGRMNATLLGQVLKPE